MHWATSFDLPFRARRSGSCGARARLRHTATYLQARQYRPCVQGVPPRWQVQEYEYAKYGRVTRITHDCDKVEGQIYSYHHAGRLQEAKNEHVLVSFRYDNLGLPVEERCNVHLIERSYDKWDKTKDEKKKWTNVS